MAGQLGSRQSLVTPIDWKQLFNLTLPNMKHCSRQSLVTPIDWKRPAGGSGLLPGAGASPILGDAY